MAKPNMSFRPRPEDAEELKKLAAGTDRSVSWIAANLISEALSARRNTDTTERSAAA